MKNYINFHAEIVLSVAQLFRLQSLPHDWFCQKEECENSKSLVSWIGKTLEYVFKNDRGLELLPAATFSF